MAGLPSEEGGYALLAKELDLDLGAPGIDRFLLMVLRILRLVRDVVPMSPELCDALLSIFAISPNSVLSIQPPIIARMCPVGQCDSGCDFGSFLQS